MKNFKISKKLSLSFMFLISLTILVAALGIYGMNYINNAATDLYNYNLLAVDAAGSIKENYSSQRGDLFCVVLYDATSDEFKKAQARITQLENEMENYISDYNATITDEEDTAQFKKFTDIYYGEFKNLKNQLLTLGAANDHNQTLTIINTTGEKVINNLGETIDQCYQYNLQLSEDSLANNAYMFRRYIVMELLYTVIAAILAAYFARYITNLTAKPSIFISNILQRIGTEGNLSFSENERKTAEEYASHRDENGQSVKMLLATIERLTTVSNSLETVANGDLTSDIVLLSDKDTIGQSLKKMNNDLNNMFHDIHSSTAQVAAGARQLSNGSQVLSQGSSEQAAAVEQLSTSIIDVTAKTKYTADMAHQASQLAQSIKNDAEKGNHQMEAMLSAVQEINDAGHNINKVIKVIDDIAFQTNILALNASVEAARAGQHGKGFAIVAEEVRNLASKSAEAAKDTSQLIATSIEKAGLGAQIANETATSLSHIVTGINESADVIVHIAESSEEQSGTIAQISNVIHQVADVVQQNSATAQESAAASEEMSGQSDVLEDLISKFKLKNAGTGRVERTFDRAPKQKQISLSSNNFGNALSIQNDNFGKF